jgi:hypothetical protein
VRHCDVCGEVIFEWAGAWVHGTSHVAIPEPLEPAPDQPDLFTTLDVPAPIEDLP